MLTPPGCGNAERSVTSALPGPKAGSPVSVTLHDRGTHIGPGTANVSTFASARPALSSALTVHAIVCMKDGVVARRPHTVSPAARLSSEKPTIVR